MAAMAELEQKLKIRYSGLSEMSLETLRRACKIHHVGVVRSEYNPFATEIEDSRIALLSKAWGCCGGIQSAPAWHSHGAIQEI